jgi:hypothetical protein
MKHSSSGNSEAAVASCEAQPSKPFKHYEVVVLDTLLRRHLFQQPAPFPLSAALQAHAANGSKLRKNHPELAARNAITQLELAV